MRGLRALALAVGLLAALSASPAPAQEAPAPRAEADAAYAEGAELFRLGSFEQALARFDAAARGYRELGATTARARALRRSADAQQALGAYADAVRTLETALPLAEGAEDARLAAEILGSLGNALAVVGEPEAARERLERAATLAREADAPADAAVHLVNLGNQQALQGDAGQALATFDEAHALAEAAGADVLAAQARANAARAALAGGDDARARRLAEQALAGSRGLSDSYDKAVQLTHEGRLFERLADRLPADARRALLASAFAAYQEAAGVAERIGDPRSESWAWGYLGGLYERRGRSEEALRLTRQAILSAQRADAPESLYRWHWQHARLLAALGRPDEAVAAYRDAVDVVAGIRSDLARRYGAVGALSFREDVGPVYLQLVDLLLRRARDTGDAQARRALLVEARDRIESLRRHEVRDYFGDECVDALEARKRSFEEIPGQAVLVYPVVLPDRLELLVHLPSGLESFPVDVDAGTLGATVRRFRHLLEKRTTREYLRPARQLYEWLVRPYEARLAGLSLDALVFAPDDPLRQVPMTALHDGERFLVARWPVAVVPGLELVDPQPLDREQLRPLLGGVSEPVQGFPPLAEVSGELEGIRELYGGNVLLDERFTLENLRSELSRRDVSLLHIASHGSFRGDVDESFLLTHDGRLGMDALAEYVGLLRFREQPLELLTLSACETAAGDERAALGLAGVAVGAGARSAVGTLWLVNDVAASRLVERFYRALQDPGVSRAVALQRAQLSLLEELRYEHPGYWSAFVLISSWL